MYPNLGGSVSAMCLTIHKEQYDNNILLVGLWNFLEAATLYLYVVYVYSKSTQVDVVNQEVFRQFWSF